MFSHLTVSCLALFGILAVTSGAANAQNAVKAPRANFKVVAYVPNWIDLKAFVPTIQWYKITHVNLAFENPINADGDLSFNADNSVLIDAARAKKIPVFLSIGGGAASQDKEMMARYFDLIAAPKRRNFVRKIADYLTKHNFDGLDVDLEGPAINNDYGAFIAELSRAIKPSKKGLTSALSQGYGGPSVPDSALKLFDWVNIMAYDGAGPWEKERPGQHSSLEFAKSNVQYWLARGLPPQKAVLGVPFYGYGFGNAFRGYEYPYRDILQQFPDAHANDQRGDSIWYNGVATISEKTRWARENKLGGVMIWSLNSDASGEHSLLNAINEVLGN